MHDYARLHVRSCVLFCRHRDLSKPRICKNPFLRKSYIHNSKTDKKSEILCAFLQIKQFLTGLNSLCSRHSLFTHISYDYAGFRGPLTYCRREYQSLCWFRRVKRRFFFLGASRRAARSLRSQKNIILITSATQSRL